MSASARLEEGDCLEVMQRLAMVGETFQAVICDPPYHLTSIVKRFGGDGAAPAQHGTDGAYARARVPGRHPPSLGVGCARHPRPSRVPVVGHCPI